MLFNSKENQCALKVLQILDKRKSKYSKMAKETKVSHTTLQRVLKFLAKKKFIKRHDIGHMKVDYEITKKGEELLDCLINLRKILS